MDYIKKIKSMDEKTQSQVNGFLDRHAPVDENHPDQDTHRAFLLSILFGALYTKKGNADYSKANNGEKLEERQKPRFLYSGGSNHDVLPAFFVGQSIVGETLVLRIPGSSILNAKGKLLPEFKTFVALGHSNGIRHLIHSKDDSSKTFELVYEYCKAGCHKGKPIPDSLAGVPAYLIKSAKNYSSLYEAVETKGLAYYAKMGISYEGAETDAEKVKLAMAAEALMGDVEAYKQYKDPKPAMVPVLHSKATGKHYVFLRDKMKFVPVPAQGLEAKANQEGMLNFLKELPDFETSAPKLEYDKEGKPIDKDTATWQDIGYALSVGYTLYKKRRGIEHKQNLDNVRVVLWALATCADSRQPAEVFLGLSKNISKLERPEVFSYRVAGNDFVDSKGKLTESTERFLAHSEWLGIPACLTGHTECGAMKATAKHHAGEGENLAEAWQYFGKERSQTYKTVRSKGKTDAKVIAYYANESGIPVETIADCLAVQLWMDGLKAARVHYPNTLGAFHDTRHGALYIENQNRKEGEPLCSKVPCLEGLLKPALELSETMHSHLNGKRVTAKGIDTRAPTVPQAWRARRRRRGVYKEYKPM